MDGSIAAPGTFSGTTTGATDDCTLNDNTRDNTIQVTIPCDGDWTFHTCDPTTNFDTWIFLGTSCCDGALADNNNFCGPQSSFTTNLTSGTYFLTIEAFGTSIDGNYLLTVRDATPPAISCPANVSVSNDPGTCSNFYNYATPVGTDNCPTANTILLSGLGAGNLFPVGANVEVYQVTDQSGNTTTCSFTVTVNDVELPTISCPGNLVSSNDPGVCGATITFTAPSGSDNCPGVVTTLTTGQGPATVFPIGITTVTYQATDAGTNSATCSFSVTVSDNEEPVFGGCPANISVSNDAGICGAVVNFVAPLATDNCPGITQSLANGLAPGSTFPVGVTNQLYIAFDVAGLNDSCVFTVTVTDNEAPQITCPSNISVANDPGQCGAVVNYTAPNATDNCAAGGALLSGLGSGGSFSTGISIETWVAFDSAGLGDTCAFMITVTDLEAPVISCPLDIVSPVDSGSCEAIINYSTPGMTDNCGGGTINLITGLGSGAVFPVGISVETWVATDTSGNADTCSFLITVESDLAIQLNVLNQITCAGQTNGTAVVAITGGCSPFTVLWDDFQTTDTATGLGVGMISVTVTDSSGAVTIDSILITAPVALAGTLTPTNEGCLGANDGDVQLQLSGGTAPFSFLWSNAAITQNLTGVGAGVYSVTVTDSNGCTYVDSVTVSNDFTPPTASIDNCDTTFCPQIIFSASASGTSPFSWAWTFGDGVGTSALQNPFYNYAAAGNGSYTVNLIVTNSCGSDTASKNVNIACLVGLDPGLNTGGFSVYPNPANGILFVQANEGTELSEIRLIDINGREVGVHSESMGQGKFSLDLSELSSGVYVVKVLSSKGEFLRKIVIR